MRINLTSRLCLAGEKSGKRDKSGRIRWKDFDVHSYLVGEKRERKEIREELEILQNIPIFGEMIGGVSYHQWFKRKLKGSHSHALRSVMDKSNEKELRIWRRECKSFTSSIIKTPPKAQLVVHFIIISHGKNVINPSMRNIWKHKKC